MFLLSSRTEAAVVFAGLMLLTACSAPRDAGPFGGGTHRDAGSSSDGGPDAGSGPSPVGGPCRSDSECVELPGGTHCLTSTEAASFGFGAPNGYCTGLSCDTNQPTALCGENTVCGPLLQAGSVCEQACSTNSDCRTGYACKAGGCVPFFRQVPNSAPEGGVVPACGAEGATCCNNTTCYHGFDCIQGKCAVCDHTVCNGSCVDLSTDNHNCGHCGGTCSESRSCVNGQCILSSCTNGQNLCTGTSGNYCADLASDINNCGSCGNKCPTTTANMTCSGGSCHIVSCLSDQIDCNHDPSDGCEFFGTACPDGTYENCTQNPNSCSFGNWCISNALDGLQCCMHPCGQDSDCPADQYCRVTLNTGAKTCAFPCSHGCPSTSICKSGVCSP